MVASRRTVLTHTPSRSAAWEASKSKGTGWGSLFDARVLHLVRRGYSAQDEPGERYDVYVIDYGAYVDLTNTQYAPQGMLPFGDEVGSYVDVPTQDLRAIRRAVLDLDAFAASL